jgi:hypothetical protein
LSFYKNINIFKWCITYNLNNYFLIITIPECCKQRCKRTSSKLQQEGCWQTGLSDQNFSESSEQTFRIGQHGLEDRRRDGRGQRQEHCLRSHRLSQVRLHWNGIFKIIVINILLYYWMGMLVEYYSYFIASSNSWNPNFTFVNKPNQT